MTSTVARIAATENEARKRFNIARRYAVSWYGQHFTVEWLTGCEGTSAPILAIKRLETRPV
jgi:hypothetical protein